MSDFNVEQMKTLLMSLGDRLNHTKGDEEMVARLANVEKLLRVTAQKLDKLAGAPQLDTKKLGDDISSAFGDVMRQHRTVDSQDRRRTRDREQAGPGGRQMLRMAFDKDDDGKARAKKDDKAASKFVNETVGFIDGLRRLDGSVAGLAKTIGLTGAAFTAVAKYADENIDAYQKLQNSAEGSITSLSGMHAAMLTASMTASELADAMTKGSDGVRLLGATKFVEFNKNIKDATRNVGFYGMSLAEITAAQGGFLETIKNQGTMFQFDAKDMTTSLDKLVVLNDKMAGILGKNRDDLLKKAETESRDPDFNAYTNGIGLDPTKAALLPQMMASLGEISPKLKDLVKDLTMGNAPRQDTAQMFSLMTEQQRELVTSLADRIQKGNFDEKTLPQIVQTLGELAKNAPKDGGVMGLLGRFTGNDQFTALNQMNNNLRSTGAAKDKVDVEKRTSEDPSTLVMLKMPELIKTMGATMDAGINKLFDTSLAKIAPSVNNAEAALHEFAKSLGTSIMKSDGLSTSMLSLAGIVGGLALLGPAIGGAKMLALGSIRLVASIARKGILETLKMFGGLITGAGSMIKNGLTGVFAAKAAVDTTKSATTALSGTADAIKASENAAQAAKGAGDAAKGASAASESVAGAAKQAGKAGDAVVDGARAAENSAKALENAAKNATSVADDAARAASNAAKTGAVAAEAGAGTKGVLQGVGAVKAVGSAVDAGAALAKKLGPIGYALSALSTWNEVEDIFKRYEEGDLKGKDDEFRKQISGALAKGLGGVAGGIAGAKVGAMIGGGAGAAAGLMAPPAAPVTTAVGAIGGGLTGAYLGATNGEAVAEKISNYVFDNLINAGKNSPEAQAPAQPSTAPVTPTNPTDATAPKPVEDAAKKAEVPLSVKDMVQPLSAMQTALVEQLTMSNTTLDKILAVLKQMQGLEQEANGISREAYAETVRQLDDIARGLKTRTIY